MLFNLNSFTTLKATILAVTVAAGLIALGCWQLNRAKEKDYLNELLKARLISQPTSLNANPIQPQLEQIPTSQELVNQQLTFMPVTATGAWLTEKYFLLDNQIVDKQVGYKIIMPFQLNDNIGSILLIDRGFLPHSRIRNELPQIPTEFTELINANLTTISGIIYQPTTGRLLKADRIANAPTWPIIIQAVDFTLLEQYLANSVQHFVVRLDPSEPAAFKQPEINFGMPATKHIGYAIQWFSLSALVMVYYFLLILRQRGRKFCK